MKAIPGRHAVVAAAAILILSHLDPASARAGHPLGTEDAGLVGKGAVEVEFNAERTRASGPSRETALGNSLTMGIAERADLAVSYSYLLARPGDGTPSVRGMGDTEIALKTSFFDGGWPVPTLGIKGGMKLPTADEEAGLGTGRADAFVVAIADWEIGGFLAHLNVKGTVAGRRSGSPEKNDAVAASLALERGVGRGVSVVGEYLWEKNVGSGGPAASGILVGGIAQLPGDVALDAGIRWGTTDASPDLVWLAGIKLTFGRK